MRTLPKDSTVPMYSDGQTRDLPTKSFTYLGDQESLKQTEIPACSGVIGNLAVD